MEIKNVSWNVKQLVKMIDNETIRFDYPIQRAGGQWKLLQKSFLIHSLAQNYPIPPIYFLGEKQQVMVMKKGEEVPDIITIRHCLDGKQRLTNIYEFVKGEYALDEDTPEATIEGVEYELAGKKYDELDEDVQDMILSRSLLTYTLDAELVSDEEIEDLFYRMNNGASLTVQQKAKALMGVEWATIVNELGEHSLIHNLASFSKTQIRTEGHITALMQTMMMLDGTYDYKNVSQSTISKYAQTFKDDAEYKKELVEKVKEAMDYLLNILDKKETVLLKKVHFPMTLMTALRAKELGVDEEEFYEWLMYFKKAIKSPDESVEHLTTYLEYTGSGTTDKHKADGRMNEMKRHMEDYFNFKQKQESL